MDNLEFLDGDKAAETVDAPVTEEAASPEPSKDGPQRGPDGKFVSKAEPEPAPQAAPEPAKPEPASHGRDGYVPITAVLDERDKRRAMEQELQALRQQFQQQQQPQYTPDPYEDPEGYDAYVNQRLAAQKWETTTQISQVMAYQTHGQQVVDEATAAFLAEAQRKPWLHQELQVQAHPYDYVVQWHKREQALAQLSDPSEIEQFRAWKAAQAQAAAAPAAVTQPQPSAPIRSLASAPSAGGAKPGEQPVGEGVAFDAIFTR